MHDNAYFHSISWTICGRIRSLQNGKIPQKARLGHKGSQVAGHTTPCYDVTTIFASASALQRIRETSAHS